MRESELRKEREREKGRKQDRKTEKEKKILKRGRGTYGAIEKDR
jgi:hypothetical protein